MCSDFIEVCEHIYHWSTTHGVRDSSGKPVVNSIVTNSSLGCVALCHYEWKLCEPNLIIVDLWTLATKQIEVVDSKVL